MTNTEYLRQRLLKVVNESEIGHIQESFAELLKSQWSSKFERLMRNRLILGVFRYGKITRQSNLNYDRVGSAIKRLNLYKSTGNLEHLVDAANLCLLEFEHSEHPDKHFEAQDDSEHVGRT